MKKRITFLLLLLSVGNSIQSQDVTFNNTNQSLVFLNPSFSGSNGYIRNQTDYRNQWPSLSGTYVFYNTCFDGFIKVINAGVSFSAYSNNIGRGIIKQRKFSAAYAQHISLANNKIKIIPSVQLNYGLNTLDRSRINYGDGFPNFGLPYSWIAVPSEQVSYFDLTAGILMKFNSLYYGAVVSNILEPNISFTDTYKRPVKTTIHASTNIALDPRTISNIFGAVSLQNNYYMTNVRIINTFSNGFLYGLGYKFLFDNSAYLNEVARSGHNASFYLGFRRKAFTIQYSFDLQIAKKYGNTVGSHELSFSLSLRKKEEEKVSTDLESK